MKRLICCLLALWMLGACALSLVGCGASDVLEGTYLLDGGEGDRIFVFSEDLLIMYQLINTDTVEFHYTYELSECKKPRAEYDFESLDVLKGKKLEDLHVETLTLTYKGLVYGGRDPYVSWYLTGQREQYAKDPTFTSELVRGDGYILINGQKYVLQK